MGRGSQILDERGKDGFSIVKEIIMSEKSIRLKAKSLDKGKDEIQSRN